MAQENGFKETKIGLIPNDWKVIKLGDCIDTKKGRKPETLTNSFEDGFEPYLTADYFRTGNTKYFVDVEKEKNSIIVDKEDIVLIWDGSNAGDVFTGLRGILASTMVKIIPKNNLTRQHLFYFLKTKFDILNEKTTGSTIPHVSKSIFEGLPFVLPPLIEQQEITFVLSKIQQTIAQQEKIVTKTKELKRSLMHRLFTYGMRGEELKETEIGLMPKSWEPMSISDISDKLIGGGTPSTKIPQYWKGNIEWTTSKRLGENIYLYDGEKKISENGLNNSSTNLIPKDNLLISTRVTVGKAVVNKADIAISQDLTGMIINKDRYSSEFIVYQFKIGRIQKIFEEQKRGATIKGITREDLKKIKLGIPDIKEQKEITNILSNVDKKIQQAETRMQGFQSLFKSMLQLLMTGQVRVKDIDFGDYL